MPSQIVRYQNILKHARSKADFVYGIRLYMSPSNMELQIATIQDYNNEIIIATSTQSIGLNNGSNIKPVPPKHTENVQGTVTRQTHPNLNYHQKVVDYAQTYNLPQSWIDGCSAEPGRLTRWINAHKKYLQLTQSSVDQPKSITEHHENNKKAIKIGSIVIGVSAFTLKIALK